jgi:hypothetical protein
MPWTCSYPPALSSNNTATTHHAKTPCLPAKALLFGIAHFRQDFLRQRLGARKKSFDRMNRIDRMKGGFSFLNPFLILFILLILSVFFGLRLAALCLGVFALNSFWLRLRRATLAPGPRPNGWV